MRRIAIACALLLPLAFAGCNEKPAAKIPPPHRMTAEDIGHYCGMNVLEHPGPKGQISVASLIQPVWFSSVRDTLAFTMLPDEPKDIQAIYVSDMGKAPNWDQPGADNWVEARKALFVIESRVKSGMGGDEAVPFSDRAAAEKFVGENGGRIVDFDEVPRDYVLASGNVAAGTSDEATEGPSGDRSRRTP